MGNRHGHDFFGKHARRLRARGFLLAGERKLILVGAADVAFGGHVFGSLRHAFHTVGGLHFGVDEAPAHGGVFKDLAARKSAVGLAHHERRAAHALHAAGNQQMLLARFDGTRGSAHGIEAGAAQAVERDTAHALGQAGQKRGHARHVAVVFTGLVGAAV